MFILLAFEARGQVPADISAFMPSKAEMRKSLVESGLSSDQIEQILSSMDFPEDITSNEASQIEIESSCEDVNENKVCDSEEDDPEVRQCLSVYQNELYATSSRLYGDSLGTNAVEVAQTCSTALAGAGTKLHSAENSYGSQGYDRGQFFKIASYWTKVLSHGRYLGDHDVPEIDDLNEVQLQSLISSFPHDLRVMMRAAGTSNMYNLAKPIHAKCERIRANVGENYRNNVLTKKICSRHVPDAGTTEVVIKEP